MKLVASYLLVLIACLAVSVRGIGRREELLIREWNAKMKQMNSIIESNPSCDWVDMHDVLRDELNSLSEISGVQWNESTNELYSRVLNHWDIIAFLDQVLSDPVYYERVKEILQTLEMVYNSDWAKCPPHEKDRPLKNGLLTISVG